MQWGQRSVGFRMTVSGPLWKHWQECFETPPTGELPNSKPPGHTPAKFRALGPWKSALNSGLQIALPLAWGYGCSPHPLRWPSRASMANCSMVSAQGGKVARKLGASKSALRSQLHLDQAWVSKYWIPNLSAAWYTKLGNDFEGEHMKIRELWSSKYKWLMIWQETWFGKQALFKSEAKIHRFLRLSTSGNWGPKMQEGQGYVAGKELRKK